MAILTSTMIFILCNKRYRKRILQQIWLSSRQQRRKLNNETITVLEKDHQAEASTASDELGDVYNTAGITKPDFPE
jgi:hypothetical protein